MKHLIIISFIFMTFANCFAQDIEPAPEGKSVVYFARPSSMGFAINFSYFDDDQFIGKFNGSKYYRYECEPGEHVFWAKAENKDFIDARLEAGKIYIILVEPKIGGLKARAKLKPVDPQDEKTMKRINKLLGKKPSETFTQEEIDKEMEDLKNYIQLGLEKYNEQKENGEEIPVLDKSI